MAELYNKVGLGLITWSPVSLGLALGSKEEQVQLFTKLALKVPNPLLCIKTITLVRLSKAACITVSGHRVQCKYDCMYTVPSTFYGMKCVVHSVHCTLYSVHCTVYGTRRSTLVGVHCTPYRIQRSMYRLQCMMQDCTVQLTVYGVQFLMHSVRYTVR